MTGKKEATGAKAGPGKNGARATGTGGKTPAPRTVEACGREAVKVVEGSAGEGGKVVENGGREAAKVVEGRTAPNGRAGRQEGGETGKQPVAGEVPSDGATEPEPRLPTPRASFTL